MIFCDFRDFRDFSRFSMLSIFFEMFVIFGDFQDFRKFSRFLRFFKIFKIFNIFRDFQDFLDFWSQISDLHSDFVQISDFGDVFLISLHGFLIFLNIFRKKLRLIIPQQLVQLRLKNIEH